MARPRADTGNFPKEPHSVSLKVLRLSRPTLSQQYPLPRETDTKISHSASLAIPSNASDQEFMLSSTLSLPPAFGSAHVGETFSCSLCANNELPEGTINRSVAGIKIFAEMQTPSQSFPLELFSLIPEETNHSSDPGSSLQNIIRFDLREEGNHVLAVNVSYTETAQGDGQATGGRVRSFRKLYQFVAQPCLGVRTKATEMTPIEIPDKSLGPYGRASLLQYALEAQLENLSDGVIVLEEAKLQSRPPFKATSLNWDSDTDSKDPVQNPVLNPRDIVQIAFLVQQEQDVAEGLQDLKASLKRDGRAVLGQLAIQWRSGMGEKGYLSTGNLSTRRKAQ